MDYPPDYFAARSRFRAGADRLGWVRYAYPIDARGPKGEELTLDVALSSEAGPEPVLVTSSGVHGVEGFFGSAIQLAALDRWAVTGVPTGVRFVFLHAVNPFGFAHVRRFDENNVDPNRNFLLDGEPFAGCPPLYPRLNDLLNPRSPPVWWEPFWLRAGLTIARHGLPALKQAVAGGQYEYPLGIFFGGRAPSQSSRLLREHLPRWLADARSVAHLDYHTGLGRWGTYKLLYDPGLTPEMLDRAGRWFGPGHLQASTPAGVSYRIRGGFGPWCAERAGGRDYVFLCAEFGTYGPVSVLAAVRAENRAHHWGEPDSPATRWAKTRLREAFCPASPAWRVRVVADGLALIDHAVAGLRGRPLPETKGSPK